MKTLIGTFLFAFIVMGNSNAFACPKLKGRFLCDGLFSKEIVQYEQSRTDGVTSYRVLYRSRGGEREERIITDNTLRDRNVFQSRSWCEGDEIHRFMFREWSNRRQTHDILIFINSEGNLEKHDIAKSFINDEFESRAVHKSVCPRLRD